MTSPTYAPIKAEDDFYQNEDIDLLFRIFTGASVKSPVVLSAAALDAAVSLSVKPMKYALASGDKIYFGAVGIVVKLTGAAAVGDTTLTVAAIAAPLSLNDQARVIQDISTFTLAYVLETTPIPTATTIISKTPTLANDPADPDGTPAKVAKVSIAATDLAAQTPGNGFFHRLRRTDSGFVRTLAQGDVMLKGDQVSKIRYWLVDSRKAEQLTESRARP